MMGRLSIFVISFMLVIFEGSAALAEASPDNGLQIEVVTVDAGAELFARWGHISIVVVDQKQQKKIAYNFGTFAFDDPGLRFRYARGFLNYWLSTVPYGPMIRYYMSQNRGVISRTLNLTPEQAETIAERLEVNALPENRTYAYRHYLDNCCTRIRDLLNDVLGNVIKEEFDTTPTGRSYRFYTIRALQGLPVMRNIILFILGREIDRPVTRWDEQFLPEVFGADLDRVTIGPDKRPLVAKKRVFLEQTGPKVGEKTAVWEIWVSAITVILLVIGFGVPLALRKKAWRWTSRVAGLGLFLWGFIGGFGGLLLILFWTGTVHYDCHNNENVLVFPVFHLWLLGPGLVLMVKGKLGAKVNRLLQRYLIASLGVLAVNLLLKLGPFFQQNYQFILFAALLNLASILLLRSVDPEPGALSAIRSKK